MVVLFFVIISKIFESAIYFIHIWIAKVFVERIVYFSREFAFLPNTLTFCLFTSLHVSSFPLRRYKSLAFFVEIMSYQSPLIVTIGKS
jgi:hypothetical protein